MEDRVKELIQRNITLIQKVQKRQRKRERHKDRYRTTVDPSHKSEGTDSELYRLETLYHASEKDLDRLYALFNTAVLLQRDMVELLKTQCQSVARSRPDLTLSTSSDSDSGSEDNVSTVSKVNSKHTFKQGKKRDSTETVSVERTTVSQHYQGDKASGLSNLNTVKQERTGSANTRKSDGNPLVTQKELDTTASPEKPQPQKLAGKGTASGIMSVSSEDTEQTSASPGHPTKMLATVKKEGPEKIRIVPNDLWWKMANDEYVKSRAMKDANPLEVGLNTVLCLDISGSMQGQAWQQLMAFVNKFLDDVEKESVDDQRWENVALVTFGHETRVVQHFTTDYKRVRRSLESLYADGPTAMYGGLHLAYGIIAGSGTEICFTSTSLTVRPRVILVTDGKPTPSGMISGPDTNQLDRDAQTPVYRVTDTLAAKGYKIFIVPVGDFDATFLNVLAYKTSGDLFLEDIQRDSASRLFRNAVFASQTLNLPGGLFLALDPLYKRYQIKQQCPSATEYDINEIERLHAEHNKELEDVKDDQSEGDVPGMPPVGSRVRRGPEWAGTRNEDSDGLGTIVGQRSNGYVRVNWDNGAYGLYCYGDRGQYQVITVDEPRVLLPHQEIGVGCRVKKGDGTIWTDEQLQEGVGREEVGVVYKCTAFGMVKVRWPNGKTGSYAYGHAGNYQLTLCSPKVQGKDTQVPTPTPDAPQPHLPRRETSTTTKQNKRLNKNRQIFQQSMPNAPGSSSMANSTGSGESLGTCSNSSEPSGSFELCSNTSGAEAGQPLEASSNQKTKQSEQQHGLEVMEPAPAQTRGNQPALPAGGRGKARLTDGLAVGSGSQVKTVQDVSPLGFGPTPRPVPQDNRQPAATSHNNPVRNKNMQRRNKNQGLLQ